MQFRAVLTLLLGFLAIATARALPFNASTTGISDYTVQTAGEYDAKNIASDAIWDKYRKKGDHYQCLFEANDEDAGRLIEDTRTPPSAQSIWKGSMYADRHIWNWHEYYFDEDNCNFEYLNLKDAFDALNLNAYCEDEGGHNMGWGLGHYDEERVDKITNPNAGYFPMIPVIEQTYTVDGKTYKSTGGYYTFVINQIDGAIVALDIFSPQNAVKTHWKSIGGTAKDEDLPKLRYMSDLVWGKWVGNNENVKNLRVYVVHNVLNTETTMIVSRAMRNKLVPKLAVWPGTVFDKEKDPVEFQAIIGSPIGGTMSILLAQHKAELGNKEIYQVNVVSDSKSIKPFAVTELHLFFQIRDVPPPKKPEEEKSTTGKRTESRSGTTDVLRRSHQSVSSPADNTILSITKDIISARDLSDYTESTDDEDYKVQTGLEWEDRRTASEGTWKKYVDKGNHFACLMRATSEGAQQLTEDSTPVTSPWNGDLNKELKTWGWHEGEVETDYDCDFERLYLKEVFNGLGLDEKPSLDEEDKPAPGHNTCFKLQHFDKTLKDPNGEEIDVLEQPYVVDGITRYATGAYYNFGVNPGGAIIGMDLVSPRYAVTERDNWNREATLDELPALRYMSDIFWGYWHRLAPDPQGLRYYIATHVVNDDTIKLVAKALQNAKMNDISEWPGITFEMETEEWAALIGSPIGASIAALLFQHKAELGLKQVTKVTVVYDSNPEKTRDRKRFRPWLHMVFHVEDVPTAA